MQILEWRHQWPERRVAEFLFVVNAKAHNLSLLSLTLLSVNFTATG
jgi:hypothetical protein